MNTIKNFLADEDGAVTVDWVVLTAAVVALALAIAGTLQTGAVQAMLDMWTDVDAALPF